MYVFKNAKEVIENKEISFDEMYHGIAFIYYIGAITQEEYKILMQLLEE